MPTNQPRAPRAGPPWWLLLLAAAGIAAGLYLWQMEPVPRLPSRSAAPSTTAPADRAVDHTGRAAPPASEFASEPASAEESAAIVEQNEPKYPLPDLAAQAGAVPAVEDSDPSILDALLALASRDQLAQFVNLQDYARRFVVTVDNLPRQRVPVQWSALRRVPGSLDVAVDGERLTLQPQNYARYDAFVRFAESIDPKAAVKVYLRFYPLLQQQYQEMGFPHAYLNDRVVAAIDDMLSAPEVSGNIRLVQPKIHYRFDDPLLESLSAGRKVMIRVGPENAVRLKKILRALRAEIVR